MRRLGLAFVLMLAACGGADPAAEPVDGATALPLPVHKEDGAGDGPGAEVLGNVEFEEDTGCVVLVQGEWRYPAVWPKGTTAQRDPFQLVLPDGTVAREGAWVEGGGGYPSEVDAERAEELSIPPVCLEGPKRTRWSEIAVFNPGSEIVAYDSGAPPPETAEIVRLPFAPSGRPSNGLKQWIEGVVEFDPVSGCVALVDSAVKYAVVWPRGTTGTVNPFNLVLPEGTVVYDGDTIQGRGDIFHPDELPAFNGFPECTWNPDTGEPLEDAWAFNHDEVVELADR